MSPTVRYISIAMGILFTLQGIGWVVAPQSAAAALGMVALDGLGRSTQFGDFAAFFLTLGVGILVGLGPGRERALFFPAALLGTAAACRALAWAVHGADFAALFIAVEVAGACVLVTAARQEGA